MKNFKAYLLAVTLTVAVLGLSACGMDKDENTGVVETTQGTNDNNANNDVDDNDGVVGDIADGAKDVADDVVDEGESIVDDIDRKN